MRRVLIPTLVIALAGACARTAGPPAGPPNGPTLEPRSPAGEAALRVARIEVRPADELAVTVGETRSVDVTAYDPGGRRVHGAPLRVFGMEGLVRTRRAGDGSVLIRGVRPGAGTLVFQVSAPAGARGGAPVESRADLRVEDLPVGGIEVSVPAGDTTMYAGTSARFRAEALTTFGLPRVGTTVEWRSGAPGVVEVGPGGAARAVAPGSAVVTASAGGARASFDVVVHPNPAIALTLRPERVETRTGDVVRFEAVVRDASGGAVPGARPAFAIAARPGAQRAGALIHPDGAFVAEEPGSYTVVASFGDVVAEAVVVAEPRDVGRDIVALDRVGHPWTAMTDLWVFEGRDRRDYAYTGTKQPGSRMYAWDVTDPHDILLTDSVIVDARTVNDVKVSPDASFAVITREGASDRRNGIVLLDTSDPAHPEIASSFTEGLTGGVHNTWIHRGTDRRWYVYAVNDGTRDVHVVDVTDIEAPTAAGRWGLTRDGRTLHDVYIQDGLAYLSYWDDGLVILDVGAGIAGGWPTEPALVSQTKFSTGNTHTAFRYGDYVFVGDEIFDSPEAPGIPRGYIHVLDVSDIENPVEVARYEVPEAGAHNIWVEDDVMYVAYYQGGLRVVDVSGELRGDLYRQGREIAHLVTEASADEGAWFANQSRVWGPQPYEGVIFLSDKYSGLWTARLVEPGDDDSTTD